MQESADLIRTKLRSEGFQEREIFNIDRSFNWDNFSHAVGNLSLFSDRKIIEVRLNSAKLEDVSKKALQSYLDEAAPDFVILITSPKLDASTLNTKWFKKIEADSVLVQIWPINRDNLHDWLSRRLFSEGIEAERDAIRLLSEKIEGNLLAAVQEIEKLKLLSNSEPGQVVKLDSKTVLQVVADSSKFSVYNLVDSALLGDATRAQKILSGLKNEGIFPLVILAAITRELRSLLPMVEKKSHGQSINTIIQSSHVWFNRKKAVSHVLQKITQQDIWQLLQHARLIDQSIKGMSKANPWDEISLLLLKLAGIKIASMAALI
jgi:DNA polymerase-3 subunit delta